MLDTTGYKGAQTAQSGSDEYNALFFMVSQILAERNTAALVRIVSVTNTGGVSPVGFVDVQPLVNQLDGNGVAMPHGVIHNLPYLRMQGGANAVILDPQVDDIGLAVFADRDISAVKASKAQANPGSMRRSDMADGLYIGGFLNGAPTQYVQFSAAGIKMHSPVAIILEAPDIQLQAATVEIIATASTTVTTPTFTVNGNTVLNGNISQSAGSGAGTASLVGPVTIVNDLTAAGKSVAHHTHLVTGVGVQTNQPT